MLENLLALSFIVWSVFNSQFPGNKNYSNGKLLMWPVSLSMADDPIRSGGTPVTVLPGRGRVRLLLSEEDCEGGKFLFENLLGLDDDGDCHAISNLIKHH